MRDKNSVPRSQNLKGIQFRAVNLFIKYSFDSLTILTPKFLPIYLGVNWPM